MPSLADLQFDGEFMGLGNTDDVEVWSWNGREWLVEGKDIHVVGSRL